MGKTPDFLRAAWFRRGKLSRAKAWLDRGAARPFSSTYITYTSGASGAALAHYCSLRLLAFLNQRWASWRSEEAPIPRW